MTRRESGKRSPGRSREPADKPARVTGHATTAGTERFAERFAKQFSPDFFRSTESGLTMSSLGMGTYLGECHDHEDNRYVEVLVAGLKAGINVIDTAINYRCQRSERAVGRALRDAVAGGSAARDEIVVCTKGGYVPLEGAPPESRQDYESYLESNYFTRSVMSPADLVAGGHCLRPRFLADQIERSKANLGIDRIDLFYLHNPEQQLDVLDHSRFLSTMRQAFAELEAQVSLGNIGSYGLATWHGFRVFPANRNYLSLVDLIGVAEDVAGQAHHFQFVQLPVNLAMTEAVRSPTQGANGKNLSLLDLAKTLGISVVASASLMQSQLTRNLPEAVQSLFPGLSTDAQRAIAFVRSLPVATALVGMRSIEHLTENIAAGSAAIQA